jgi:hypothetical protein
MTNQELARGAARRLAIIRHAREVSGNVAGTCRYYGISRQAYDAWLRRYEAGGVEARRDRSRRPHVSPTPPRPRSSARSSTSAGATTSGPTRSPCTKRYHDIAISPSGVVADSDIGVVLPDVTGHRPHHLFAIPTRGQDRTHRKNCLGRSGKGQRHRLDRPAQAGC